MSEKKVETSNNSPLGDGGKTETSNNSPLGDGGNNPLNIGILGLGEGRSTVSAVLQSSKLNLQMICDQNLDLCRQRADEFKVYEHTTDYQEMLDDETIDIIAIYTPDHLHAEHVKRALLANKHVVCTKPF